MVLVPGDQLLDGAAVHVLRGGTDRLVGVGRPRPTQEHPATHAEIEADRRRLVDDDDALPVGLLQDLLGIGVVGGPERVGADPAEECEVVQHGGVVVAAAVDVQILVLAEAPEGEGLAVDEEPCALDPDGADAHRERVAVDDDVAVDQFGLEVVEVPAPGPPELRRRHAEFALGPVGGSDLGPRRHRGADTDAGCTGVGRTAE